MLVNGKKSKVGQPYVKNASAEGVILGHDKAKKGTASLVNMTKYCFLNYLYCIKSHKKDDRF